MPDFDYHPIKLPPITAVEVVPMQNINSNRVSEYMRDAKHVPGIRLTGDPAQHVAALFRKLPAAEQMRCHTPPFGFRFFSESKLICEASVCWSCNNLFGFWDGLTFHYAFSGNAAVSKQLLEAAKAATGNTSDTVG